MWKSNHPKHTIRVLLKPCVLQDDSTGVRFDDDLAVFTETPEALYGVTFIVVNEANMLVNEGLLPKVMFFPVLLLKDKVIRNGILTSYRLLMVPMAAIACRRWPSIPWPERSFRLCSAPLWRFARKRSVMLSSVRLFFFLFSLVSFLHSLSFFLFSSFTEFV